MLLRNQIIRINTAESICNETTSKVQKKYLIDEENHEDEHDTDEDDEDLEKELGWNHDHNKWRYVMTFKSKFAVHLPKYFKLDPVYPGEPACIRRRDNQQRKRTYRSTIVFQK